MPLWLIQWPPHFAFSSCCLHALCIIKCHQYHIIPRNETRSNVIRYDIKVADCILNGCPIAIGKPKPKKKLKRLKLIYTVFTLSYQNPIKHSLLHQSACSQSMRPKPRKNERKRIRPRDITHLATYLIIRQALCKLPRFFLIKEKKETTIIK